MSDPTPPPAGPAAPGWYPDPQVPGQQRYWDGAAWGAAAALPSAPTTSTKAVIGLILAIVSWVMCPIIAAIAALVLARSSSREIAASGGRIDGAGLNTATRIIAWINIGISIAAGILIAILAVAGVIFSANVASGLDPAINERTGLSDGEYVMEPARRASFDNECSYGGTTYTVGRIEVGDITVYGQGPLECPDLEQVDAVLFAVEGGIARIIAVE